MYRWAYTCIKETYNSVHAHEYLRLVVVHLLYVTGRYMQSWRRTTIFTSHLS